MIRYRIYTEQKNLTGLIDLINSHLQSCTIFTDLTGIYKGERENSLVVEYIGTGNEKDTKDVLRLCKEIKEFNSQNCVLLTRETVDSQLI